MAPTDIFDSLHEDEIKELVTLYKAQRGSPNKTIRLKVKKTRNPLKVDHESLETEVQRLVENQIESPEVKQVIANLVHLQSEDPRVQAAVADRLQEKVQLRAKQAFENEINQKVDHKLKETSSEVHERFNHKMEDEISRRVQQKLCSEVDDIVQDKFDRLVQTQAEERVQEREEALVL